MEGGVFPAQTIRDFIQRNIIHSYLKIHPSQVQPSTLDLRAGRRAWRVPASFLVTSSKSVQDKIKEYGEAAYLLDLSAQCFMEMGKTYVIELAEEFRLPPHIQARSNPKSSSGRIDVFVRLITEHGDTFDTIPAGYNGKTYLILFSNSFDLLIKEGVALNQVRFFVRGDYILSTNELKMLYSRDPLIFTKESKAIPVEHVTIAEDGLFLTLDLDDNVVGYRSKRNTGPIDLTKLKHHPWAEYWEKIPGPRGKGLILDPHYFYLLKSKERVAIPIDFAAEMVPFHSGIGEFRSHYAGFFDPAFGFGKRGEIKGSCAVLEVRMRDLPMQVHDGQKFVKLVYERMIAKPDIAYGVDIKSHYQSQGLRLSKHFV